MRSAAGLLFAAILSFSGLTGANNHVADLDTGKCAFDPSAMISDACVSYGTINSLNDEVYTLLQSITLETDFFSYYRLNLFNKECPFWQDSNSMCGNIACAVNTIDSEEDIPLVWRAEELSKLEGPKAIHPPRRVQVERPERPLQGMLGEGVGESCVVEYDDECDDRDYCVPEDEGSAGKGDYVSLVDNPERFTGYSGEGARQIWDAIYRENCFLKPVEEELEAKSLNAPMGGLQAVSDFRNMLQKESHRHEGLPLDNECLEKRVYHRLLSGMHASISTHLCWDYLNQTTGKWHPNMQCYKDRLHDHPERISNMYFNYALVSRAVAKLQKHLESYTFCTSDPEQDADTKLRVSRLTEVLARPPKIFDEAIMFQDPMAQGLKEDFRNHFRNVSRVMDCVGCDKCRLWGKLQTSGYGTALKVLFEYDETKNGENPMLRRTELVALINTLGRLSHSIAAARSFHDALEADRENAFPLSHYESLTHRKSEPEPESESESKPEHKLKKESKVETDQKQTPAMYHDGTGNIYYKHEEGEWSHGREKMEGRKPWERPPLPADHTAWDDIYAEWVTVRDTTIFVLKSWWNLPITLYDIVVFECQRAWAFWLGMPVPPRPWGFKAPGPHPTLKGAEPTSAHSNEL